MKDASEFSPNPSQSTGLDTYCRPCFNVIKRADKVKHHGSTRNYHLRHRYGITEQDFDEMSVAQEGLCAICREAPAAHVDHDHATGTVRGLLCFNCNGALGQFRDRADLMLRAVIYLQRDAGTPFVDVPGTPTLYVGPDDDPRPPGEAWPPDYAA